MYRKKILAALMVVIITIPVSAHAQSIDDSTKCTTVAEVMDAPEPEKKKVAEITRYIVRIMRTLDHSYAVRGKVEILPRLSSEGLSGVVATASVRCRSHLTSTVRDVTIESYEGVRALQDALGVND